MLQETYLGSDDFTQFKTLWDGPVFYSPARSNRSCGVALAFSNKLRCSYSQLRHDDSGRCVSTLCTFQDFSIRICNVYSPCVSTDRRAFFNEVVAYTRGKAPVIVGGDFNCIFYSEDRLSDSLNNSCFIGRTELQSLLHSFDLIDSWRSLHSSQSGHTWFHKNKGISSRLDRIYVNNQLKLLGARVIKFPLSDHDAVHVDVDIPVKNVKSNCIWKCNVSILNDSIFKSEFIFLYRLWRTLQPGFLSITDWWEDIKGRIREFCISHGIRKAREKRRTLGELQSRCLHGDNEEVARILADERRGAFIRSRERFLEDGERPGYFYMKERSRSQGKVIKEIRNAQGCIVEGDGIENVFHDFYTRLYSKCDDVDISVQNMLIDRISGLISSEDSTLLDRPIELPEIKAALSGMARNKSPGIDGIPVEFYLEYFDVLGEDLLGLYNDIFNRKLLSDSQRISVITLLPKSGDTLDPGNRRPISLLTTDYKIISKILQLRLSQVLPSIINVFQTCSVPGRSIHQNLCIIRDIVDFVKLRGNPCALISMDQHKAFDKVDWSFLFKVLGKMNFGPYFMSWVNILYTDIRSKILVNGQLSADVLLQRGVRQGCPLSPALYVIFMEPLARHILQCDNIRGFHIPGGGGMSVKLLQYADDATCVATSQGDIIQYFDMFKLFERATGASLNLKKTHGLRLGDFVGRKLKGDIIWVDSHIFINGVCFGKEIYISQYWKSLVEKAKVKVKTWERRYLTLLGKVNVINTCLFPLFYYAAPVYLLEKNICTAISRVVFPFLWKGGTELVSRQVVMLHKSAGGLGVDNFVYKMTGLLIRPLLPVLAQEDNESCKFFLARYFMAKSLRTIYPFLWSNSVPHCDDSSTSYKGIARGILYICNTDKNFHSKSKKVKDIVQLLVPHGVVPRVEGSNTAWDWPSIWKDTLHPLLCNGLKSFSWRATHGALCTKGKLHSWGLGDGRCCFCSKLENMQHVFWDCNSVYPILMWVNRVTDYITGLKCNFTYTTFVYGFPTPGVSKAIWSRLWFFYVSVRRAVWNRRCKYTHQKFKLPDSVFIEMIKNEVRLRILVDFKRWSREKFKKIYVERAPLVSVVEDEVQCHFQ